jgi:hypothetical protein
MPAVVPNNRKVGGGPAMMSRANAGKPTVFISYSHEDKRWRERLERQLTTLMAEGLLDVWSDQAIRAGESVYERIAEAITRARIAILLVSADFLTSEFIRNEEVPRLLERRSEQGMQIVPVICRPCPWRQVHWLSSMLVRPQDGRPLSVRTLPQSEAELAAIAEEVYRIVRQGEEVGTLR